MKKVAVIAARRTPVGAFQGGLSSFSASELGSLVIKSLLEESGLPTGKIDQVIMGQVLTAGCGQNPARQSALLAGLNVDVQAMTINKVCGSGLKAVHLGVQAIQCGEAEFVIAGGQENMTRAPYVIPSMRAGARLGHVDIKDSLVHDGLWDAFNDFHMGVTAENVAKKFGITRLQQDQYAEESHRRALAATADKLFSSEIVSVNYTDRRGNLISLNEDEGPRVTSLDKLTKLKPAFDNDGTVTAGNASSLNDGAAAVLMCSADKATELGIEPLAIFETFSNSGIEPEIMGIAPISAIKECLSRLQWCPNDIDVLECNEAFSAQALAVLSQISIPPERVNPLGGAIALGHPIGASGCRILVTLLHYMARNNLHKGIAALCIGGGEGVAMALSR